MLIDNIFKEIKYIDKIKKIVINLSGGLDSTILLYTLAFKFGSNRIIAVSFDYNQKHKNIELFQAQKSTKKLGVKHVIIPIPFLGIITKKCSSMIVNGLKTPTYNDIESKCKKLTTYVPFRNLVISSICLSFAESVGANSIALGIQYGDYENKKYEYWDCSQKFQEKIQELVFLNPKNKIYVLSPFINLKKEQELQIAIQLNIPIEDTWTCYNPKIEIIDKFSKLFKPCLCCPSCISRLNSFNKNNLKDPILNGIIIKESEEKN